MHGYNVRDSFKKPTRQMKQSHRHGVVYSDTTFEVTLSDGKKIMRDMITKSPCVVALVKDTSTSNPTAILVNEFRIGSMKNENGFPAGIIDHKETPIQAVVREVIEETGMIPYKVDYLGESFTSSGFTNEKIHYFYVEVNNKEMRKQELDHDEQITLVHIPFNDIWRYINDGELTGSHAHACLLKYLMKEHGIWLKHTGLVPMGV